MALRQQFSLIFNYLDGGFSGKIRTTRQNIDAFDRSADRAGRRTDQIGRSMRKSAGASVSLGKAMRTAGVFGAASFDKVSKTSKRASHNIKTVTTESDRAKRSLDQLARGIVKADDKLKRSKATQAKAAGAGAGGGAGVLGFLAGGGGRGGATLARGLAGGFIGFAALGGANQLGQAIKDLGVESVLSVAKIEQLGISLDVLAKRFNVSRTAMTSTEDTLRSYGLTTLQALDAIQLFTRAGATQAEVLKLVTVAMDAAARRGFTLDEAIGVLAQGVAKAEPEILDNLGIIVKMSQVYDEFAQKIGVANGESLTVAQRSKALVSALTQQVEKGGEFNAIAGTLSRTLIDISQTTLLLKENLGSLFAPLGTKGASLYLTILQKINASLQEGKEFLELSKLADEFPEQLAKFRTGVGRGNTGPLFLKELGPFLRQLESLRDFQQGLSPEVGPGGVVSPLGQQTREQINAFQDQVDQAIRGVESSRKSLQASLGRAQEASRALLEQNRALSLTGLERLASERQEILRRLGATAKDIEDIRKRFDPQAQLARIRETTGARPSQEQFDQIVAKFDPAKGAAIIKGLQEVRRNVEAAFDAKQVRFLLEETEKLNAEFDQVIAKSKTIFTAARVEAAAPEDAIPGIGASLERAAATSQKLLTDASAKSRSILEARVQLLKQEAAVRTRILQLERGVDQATGQAQDARVIAALEELRIREQLARSDQELFQARLDATIAIRDAQLQSDLEVAQARRQQIDDFREAVVRAFDSALREGSGGLRDVFQSIARGIQRQIVGNLAEELFRIGRDSLNLEVPGQRGKGGKLTALGRVLRGTPFGVDPAKTATDNNTKALESTRVSLDNLSLKVDSLARGLGGGGGVVGVSGEAGGLLGKLDDLIDGAKENSKQLSDSVQRSTSPSARLSQIGALGAAGVGGFLGVRAGVRQGGIGGALTVGSSAAAATAIALKAFKVLPGLGTALEVGAIAAGLIGSLFGRDSREALDRRVQQAIEANRVTEPLQLNRESDLEGVETDRDIQGNLRPIIVNDNRTIHIDAIDVQSLKDRGAEILEALTPALQDANPFSEELRADLLRA